MMPEELKPCPFCGCDLKKFPPEMIIMRSTSDAYVEWEIAHGLILGDSNQWLVMCERCGAKGQGGVTKEEAIKNWNRRAQQPNEALTVDELRQMIGSPIWISGLNRYGILGRKGIDADDDGKPIYRYVVGFAHGWEWIEDVLADGRKAYRRPPEAGEKG